MLKIKRILLVIALLSSATFGRLFAQNEISSPYSRYGVGIVNNNAPASLQAMGGVVYALQSNLYINFRNPASYVAFDSLSFIADVAFDVVNSQLNTVTQSQKGSYGRASYITIGLPVTRHWRTSVGILPFSSCGYNIVDDRTLDGIGAVEYRYAGEGGLMQLYWGNAFKIWKGLSIGLNASYMFGTLATIRYEEFEEDYLYNYRIYDAELVDGIYLQAGLQYMANVAEHHKIGVGLVYENSAYIWARKSTLINHYTGVYSSAQSYDTTYAPNMSKGNIRIPQSIGGGLSYTFKNKLSFGVDVTWQNWSKYTNFGQGDSLKDAIITNIGLQFIPDPTSGKFGKNIAFRIGGKYSTGYIFIKNTPIQEYAVSFGIGLPLRSYNTKCSLNIMFEYSGMGTKSNNLAVQNYFKVGFNFILQERWYQRVKLE